MPVDPLSQPSPTDAPTPPPAHPLDEPEAGGRAIRGAGLRAGSYVASALLSLVTAPLIIRHLGIAEFGRYATVLAIIAVVAGVTDGGLGPVGVREYAILEGEARARFMRNLYGLRVVLTSTGVVAAVVFAWAVGYQREQVAGCAVAGVALLVMVTQGTLVIPLAAELRLGRQVAAELTGQVLLVALVVVIVVTGGGILPLLGAPIISSLVVTGISLSIPGVAVLRPGFELGYWRGVLRDTLPVGLNAAVHTIYFRSVIVLMSLTTPALQTGYFATAYRVVEVALTVPVTLVGTTFPILVRAAHRDAARLRFAAQRLFDTGVVVGVWLATVTAIGAPFIIGLLTGHANEPSTPVLRILSVTMLVSFVSSTCGHLLLALRRHRDLVRSTLLAFVVTAGVALAIVPSGGAREGALASVAGEVALLVVLAVTLLRVRPELRPELGVLARAVPAGAVAAAIALAASLPSLAAAALFTAVYALLALASGAVPRELRDALVRPVAALRRG